MRRALVRQGFRMDRSCDSFVCHDYEERTHRMFWGEAVISHTTRTGAFFTRDAFEMRNARGGQASSGTYDRVSPYDKNPQAITARIMSSVAYKGAA